MTNDLNTLGASHWVQLAAPPRTEGHPASIEVLNDGKMACTFSGRINTTGSFTASSGVFIYDPVTGVWTDVSDPDMYYWTKDIVIDPNDLTQNTWYAGVFSGWGGTPNGRGGLYRTTNRGISWTKLTSNQFDRVTSLAFNPQNLSQAYLTTETQGLWVTQNINAATPLWNLVESYPFRQPERVFFNPFNTNEMWVTSFGNGMKVGLTNGTSTVDVADGKEFLSVFPNPFSHEFRIQCSRKTDSFMIFDGSGRLMATGTLEQGQAWVNTSDWSCGVYLVKFAGKTVKVTKIRD